jgi:hypothetical protein
MPLSDIAIRKAKPASKPLKLTSVGFGIPRQIFGIHCQLASRRITQRSPIRRRSAN